MTTIKTTISKYGTMCFHKLQGGYGIKQDEYRCVKCGATDMDSIAVLLFTWFFFLIGRVEE